MITKFKIASVNEKFEGISSFKGKKAIIKGALENEVVEAEIIQEKKNVVFAEIRNILTPYADRNKENLCRNKDCPGCSLNHLKYSNQILRKSQNLKKILKLKENPKVQPSEQQECRNKVILPFKIENNELILGMFQPGSNNIINQEFECPLLLESIRNIVSLLKRLLQENRIDSQNFMFIRGNQENELQIGFGVTNQNDMPALKQILTAITKMCKNIKSVFIYNLDKEKSNSVLVRNPEYLGDSSLFLTMRIKENRYKVSPEAFFQMNFEIIQKITKDIGNYFLNLNLKDVAILDVCSGVGVLSEELLAYLPKDTKRILLEITKEAFTFLKEDEYTKLVVADITKENFTLNFNGFFEKSKKNIVILDPPRKGVGLKIMNQLKNNKPDYLIYLSCNPKTQARDLEVLGDLYSIDLCKGYDMFPFTPHLESLVILKKTN